MITGISWGICTKQKNWWKY